VEVSVSPTPFCSSFVTKKGILKLGKFQRGQQEEQSYRNASVLGREKVT